MSAQGGTLQRRGTIELPVWPVAVLVVAAVAAAIGMTVLRDAGQTRFVTSVTDSERFANSTAAVREQGAALPVVVGISHVTPRLSAPIFGISHVTPRLSAPTSAGYAGAGPATGIMVNGEICHQCR